MSNEIKNTLFRFVSMRAPELVTEATTKPGFVFQNDSDKGIFNTATASIPAGSTKQEVLKDTATNFKSNAKTVEDLKVLNTEFYDFSVWLAKNRFSATDVEIKAKAELVTTTTLDLKTVWENLFYQVVTQSDFYAKEVAMQLLLAYHVNMSTTLGTYKERATAKVVLPKEVFLEEKTTAPSVEKTSGDTVAEVPFASHTFQKLENKALAEDNNRILQRLKIELAQAEALHKKNYEAQYKETLAKHQAIIKPILDVYNNELEELKKNWCATQDPTKPLDSTNPCSQPPTIPQPELPEFNFPYDDTIDVKFLESVLSPESFEVYTNIVNPREEEEDIRTEEMYRNSNVVAKALTTSANFTNLTDTISDLTDTNNNTIQQNTVDTGSTAVVIGGSVITVPNTQSPLLPLQYEVKTRRKSLFLSPTNRTLQISLGIPDNTFKIAQVKYKMTRTDSTFIERTASDVQHFSGYDALLNLSMTGITENLSEMFITFQFVNGQIATLSIPNFNLLSAYKGFLKIELNDSEFPGGGDTTGGNTTVAPDENFIPSGFGIKQLGVADYNKVEQTIQGYIEGEVAHIENVMAREFKEKSTRRLRRSEVTETTSSETERENLTDTSTVDRFEMQSEVAKVIANSKDFNAGADVRAHYGITDKNFIDVGANMNFATHNSKEESTRQAVTNSKEITERALDRIVSKVKEERIEKVLEEFEENNTHGFDNRKGDKHVVGVYRWVDKVYKNQIVNYGKRLMFEFAIPEPASLHWLAMTEADEK
ncbi:hypothetical protein [Flavobacterium sp.]|uniref:hypothetical protein n=1 Tax=Flavobacterium sp. TaxID=239 RepID=UPI003526CEC7